MQVAGREFKEVMAMDFFMGMASGNVPGFKHIHKFWENPDVGAAWETIWGYGWIYQYLTAATKIKAASVSANDTAAGTGARTIKIYWLDANYNEIDETLSLNWQTPVETTQEFLRIHRTEVLTAGSGATQDGNIYVWVWTFTAWVPAQILSGSVVWNNQSLTWIYTIPAGYTGFVRFGKTSAPQGKSVDVKFFTRVLGGVFRVQHSLCLYQNNYDYPFLIPIPIPEKSDVETRALSSATGTKVTMAFDVILIKNTAA